MSHSILTFALPILASLVVRDAVLRLENPRSAETEATVVEVQEDALPGSELEPYLFVTYVDDNKVRNSALSYVHQLHGNGGPSGLGAAQKSFPVGSKIRVRYAPGYQRFGIEPAGS